MVPRNAAAIRILLSGGRIRPEATEMAEGPLGRTCRKYVLPGNSNILAINSGLICKQIATKKILLLFNREKTSIKKTPNQLKKRTNA